MNPIEEPIILEPYSEEWILSYETEKQLISNFFEGIFIEIHHIGSTAIPSISAKPIIDILVEVNSIENIDQKQYLWDRYQYIYKGENGIPNRGYYVKYENGVRKFHVHCYATGDKEIERHLRFRDILIFNHDVAKEYEKLKLELAQKYKFNRAEYTAQKAKFIESILIIA